MKDKFGIEWEDNPLYDVNRKASHSVDVMDTPSPEKIAYLWKCVKEESASKGRKRGEVWHDSIVSWPVICLGSGRVAPLIPTTSTGWKLVDRFVKEGCADLEHPLTPKLIGEER